MAAFEDKQVTAAKYMAEKKITEIFTHLATKILYARPDDPKDFLKKEIMTMIESGSTGGVSQVFTESDLRTLFDMHAEDGVLDLANAAEVFGKLGLKAAPGGEGDDEAGLTFEAFLKQVQQS